MHQSEIVGIDLGTTYSAIGRLGPRGRPELFSINGHNVCPSLVSFPEDGPPLVGQEALNRLAFAPRRAVRSAKRRMGRGRPYSIGGTEYRPEEIQALILRYLVREATSRLGVNPRRAVITVPAYFDQVQRQATRRAGELAGLVVERLLNEPTAASLAYHPDGGARQILVYDFGGGTFDASVVRQDHDLVEVLASHGDTELGGDDIDRALADHLLKCWVGTRGADGLELRRLVLQSVEASTRLDLAVEKAKRELSSCVETVIRLEYLVDHQGTAQHFEMPLTRSELEELIRPFLQKTLSSAQQALDDARLDAGDLDRILLVGGSTRIPAVWEVLQTQFGLEPDRSLNPEECVALGACIQAGLIEGLEVNRILVDVSPYSLSVSHFVPDPFHRHMECKVITPRNTPIPSSYSERFHALLEDQEAVEIFVFQGGDVDPQKNRCIGRLFLSGLARTPGEETPSITVDFRYNLDGIVEVILANRGSGRTASARIKVDGLGTCDLMDEFVESVRSTGIAPGPGSRIGIPSLNPRIDPTGEAPPPEKGETPILQLPLHNRSATEMTETSECDSGEGYGEGIELDSTITDFAETAGYLGLPPRLTDDYVALKRIMGRFPELRERHASRVAELQEAIERARAAFQRRPLDPAEATEAYDELTDLLFDLGEFF